MTGQAETYYYLNVQASTVFYSEVEIPGEDSLEFLGKSNNPKQKMAAAVMLQQRGVIGGISIKPWIFDSEQ